MSKRCCACKETKSTTEFHRNRSTRDGLQTSCKACQRLSQQRNKDAVRVRNSRWKRDNRHKELDSYLRRTYGISSGEYAALLESQDDVCAICREACNTGKRLAVDHSHETRRVRGLLCMRCNRALGYFRDSPRLLNSAKEYLECRS